MKLVYKDTNREVKVGDSVILFDGTVGKVTYFRPPHKSSSSGKISVRLNGDSFDSEYFVSVIGAEWIEREDRGYAVTRENEMLNERNTVAPPTEEKDFYVTYKIDARYVAKIKAKNLEEAKQKASEDFSDADFGAAEDIDGEPIIIENEAGDFVWEK